MAFISISDKFARPLHFLEPIPDYEATAVPDTIATDLGLLKADLEATTTSLQTQITLLQAYITANPSSAEDLDPIKTALDTAKAEYDTAVTDLDGIISDYGDKPTDQDVVDVLQLVHDDMIAAIQAGTPDFDARTQLHARCQNGKGWYYKSQDTGNAADEDVRKLCPGCGAHGYVESTVVDTPVYVFPTTEEAPDEVTEL